MTEQQGHPAGWYKTADGTREVWFDGQNWTQHARPVTQAPLPVPPAQTPSADYGQPSQAHNPYGASPYAAAARPRTPGYGINQPGARSYASWIKRVAATLIDTVIVAPFVFAAGVVVTASTSTEVVSTTGDTSGQTVTHTNTAGLLLGIALYLAGFGLGIWNQWIRQGKTGYSLGKQALGIRLVKDATNQPTGVGLNIGRSFAHIVDSLICDIGYLWPLWDAKRQTLADKICSTVVVEEPKG